MDPSLVRLHGKAMHIKVISFYPERVEANMANWQRHGEVEVIHTTESIPQSHHFVAQLAIEDRWDITYLVLQDDVTILRKLPAHMGDITAYGRSKESHVCPHAWTATVEGWHRLERTFRAALRFPNICPRFLPSYVYADVVDTGGD